MRTNFGVLPRAATGASILALALPHAATANDKPMDPAIFGPCAEDIMATTALKPILRTEATASHAGKSRHLAKGALVVEQLAPLNSFVEDQGIVNCDGKATVSVGLKLKVGSFTQPVPKFHLKREFSNEQNIVRSRAGMHGTFLLDKACKVAGRKGKKYVDVNATEKVTYEAPGYPAVSQSRNSFLAKLACNRRNPDYLPVSK